ncbi:MAG: hypothetical protein ACNA8P_13750, partial [Phycisphaerales bacterium]
RRFDGRGRPFESLSPWRDAGSSVERQASRVFFNDLGEVVGSIENAIGDPVVVWDGGGGRYRPHASQGTYSHDQSRTITFNRNFNGQVTERMAWKDATSAQTTRYEYEHGISGVPASSIAVNWLVRRVSYPDRGTGDANSDDDYSERFAYNRLGELITHIDQNGTQHQYTRDALGRVTIDAAAVIASPDIDGAVRSLEYTYDSAGRIRIARSYSTVDPRDTNSTILNAARYSYDSLGRLTQIEQNPLGDIAAYATTGIVDIDYEDVAFNASSAFGTHNISRATALKYPLGAQGASSARTVLSNTFGAAGSLDDIISRATGFQWNRGLSSQVHSVSVERLGLGAPVRTVYEVPDLAMDRIQSDPLL